jgi:hypothetical protein
MEPTMNANIVHPSSDTLESFGLGRLDSFSADPVRQHLTECSECRQKVAELAAAKRAVSKDATPSPTRPLSLVSQVLQGRPTGGVPVAQTVPPELANHPQYEILRLLGRGGMGVVYLAKNKLMDRLEVLKVINQALMDKPGSLERFLREIRETAKLSHVNVVKAYSAMELGELLVFAMEYVEGEDLGRYVQSHGPLPVPYACFYARQVAQGLQHAFEKGMVHRDIKPQNLILAREGRKHLVKILDFGLAKATSEKRIERELTGVGRMLGSPDYMAPEQILDASTADIRADIYSLGCTLYYLLTGAPCFQANSLLELLQAHQSLAAKPLNLVRPEIPAELAKVVAKMMAKDPAQRYQTPAEVAQALQNFLKSGGQTEATSAPAAALVEGDRTANRSATASVGATASFPVAQGWVDERIAPVSRAGGPLLPQAAMLPVGTITAAPAPKRGSAIFWLGGLAAAVMLLLLFLVTGVGLMVWAANRAPTVAESTKTEPVLQQQPDPKPPPVPQEGTLVLQQVPDGAEVYIDGKRMTITRAGPGLAVELRTSPGNRQIEVRKTGFKSYFNTVLVVAGGQLPVQVYLEPLQAFIVLEHLPQGAEVHIDNIRVTYNAPAIIGAAVEFPANPGNHHVEVRKLNYKNFVTNVNVAAGSRVPIQVYMEQLPVQPLPPPPPPPAADLIRYKAEDVAKFMNQAVVRVTNIANQAKGVGNLGYENGVSILGGWIQQNKSLSVTYNLPAGVDYVFIAGGDNDATRVDLEVLDANNTVLARDNANAADSVVAFTPQVAAKYTLRLSLVQAKNNVPCVCALVILKKNGWNVPVQNLDKAVGKVMKALDLVDKEAQKLGKRIDLFQGNGQWAFYGGVLNPGQNMSMTNLNFGFGDRFYLGVGDDFATVTHLQLEDAKGNQLKRDPLNNAVSVLEYNHAGATHGLRLYHTQGTAASVVLMAAFDVYVPK